MALDPIGDRPERGDILGQLDKDGDGKISKDEAPARLKENFDKVDKDGDGFISRDEAPTGPPRGRPDRL